ncbi:MAG: D-Ala-D-Ala carboxypeptidase family metallohydrolase [Candidimonas sp.]
MKLSANFTLEEMIRSQTASRLGIDNMPRENEIIENLRRLCVNVLQPLRSHFGYPVIVSSGYRSLRLNRAIGSKDSSQHIKGQAADFEVVGMDNYDIACWIRDNLDYDQLILEMYRPNEPRSGWVHCSWVGDDNRNEDLTIFQGGRTVFGLVVQ